MGWILDLLNGPDLTPERTAQLSNFESQFDILQRENVQLKIESDKLKEQIAVKELENQQLQQENQDLRKTREFPQVDTLDESKLAILRLLAEHDEIDLEYFGQLLSLRGMNLKQVELRYHLEQLETKDFIGSSPSYFIIQTGRAYLVENKLL